MMARCLRTRTGRLAVAKPRARFSASSSGPTNSKPLFFASGFAGGGCGSLVGLGGGFVIVPLLTGYARFTQHQAHGTSLACVAATSTAGALTYGSDGALNLPAAAIMAATATITAGLGARFTAKLNAARLQQILGAFMLCMAPLVPLKPYLLEHAGEANDDEKEKEMEKEKDTGVLLGMGVYEIAAYSGIGLATGFVSGLFGIGGGSIMTPALALLTPLSQHAVIGTSLASMAVPSLVGARQHFLMGNIVTHAVAPVLVGTASGAYLGSRFGLSLPEDQLRIFFGGLMLLLGGRQFVQATRKLRLQAVKR